ncbi:hypothetical protein OROGR_000660 [Orobanche gracilis]
MDAYALHLAMAALVGASAVAISSYFLHRNTLSDLAHATPKIYPILIKLPPLKPIITGIAKHVIPIWSSIPEKANSNRRLVMDKFVHPSVYGDAADIFDHLFYAHLQAEFELPRAYRAAHFAPSSWMNHSSGTRVGLVPSKICPRLPMLDLNKDTLTQGTKELEQEHSRQLMLAGQARDLHDLEAAGFWESHIRTYSREVSSSGLSNEAKKDTPTVRGRIGFSLVRHFIHNDVLVVPMIGPLIEEDSIYWEPDLPKPAPEPQCQSLSTSRVEAEIAQGPPAQEEKKI